MEIERKVAFQIILKILSRPLFLERLKIAIIAIERYYKFDGGICGNQNVHSHILIKVLFKSDLLA
jgi:hypothetical protein